jgi:protein tyrosine/serine phosphatase
MFQAFITIFVFAALAVTGFGADRNPAWAVKMERAGLPNLHRVTTNLYRCAQPTADGLRAAEAMGIKTVVSLRAFHSDKDEVESTKLRTRRIYFNTWHAEDEDVVRFLKIIADTNAGPILVHCKHGADRTGTMIAIYRMALQGWTKEEAIKEMTTGDFGYHTVWKNLIRYLNRLDVEALRKRASFKFAPAK